MPFFIHFTLRLIGKPQEFEREVSSLQSLQNQPQASATWNMQQNLSPWGGAQGFSNPNLRGSLYYGQQSYPQPSYQPQPYNPYNSYPQMPSFGLSGNFDVICFFKTKHIFLTGPILFLGNLGFGGYQVGGSAGYFPNNGYYPSNGGQVEVCNPLILE